MRWQTIAGGDGPYIGSSSGIRAGDDASDGAEKVSTLFVIGVNEVQPEGKEAE